MNTRRLREFAADPTFIPGVYAHCDRWCERCGLTHRCLNFRWATEARRDLRGDEPTVEEAVQAAGEALEMAVELIREMDEEDGVDFETLEAEAAAGPPRESALLQACAVTADEVSIDPHGLVFLVPDPEGVELVARAAFGYARAVSAWFDRASESLRAKAADLAAAAHAPTPDADSAAEGRRIHDALEVVGYYQHFIPIRLVRAVCGVTEGPDAWASGCSGPDADGSAKAALLAMDRSAEAWARLRASLPEEARRIRDLLAHLDRLRRETEARFPRARAFVRPGLDES